MNSTISKKNAKKVIKHAFRAFYMLKRGFLGLGDTTRGPNSLKSYLYWMVMLFAYQDVCMRSTVSKKILNEL